jgi:hypothetical protein
MRQQQRKVPDLSATAAAIGVTVAAGAPSASVTGSDISVEPKQFKEFIYTGRTNL